jgi:hypothetical protein
LHLGYSTYKKSPPYLQYSVKVSVKSLIINKLSD